MYKLSKLKQLTNSKNIGGFKMHKQRISIIISGIIGIIAVFIPYMSIWSRNISLIESKDYSGYIVLGLFIISVVFSIPGERNKKLPTGFFVGSIISGIIPGIIMIAHAINLSNKGFSGSLSSYNVGFYLIILASLSIPVLGGIFQNAPDQNSTSSLNQSVNTIYCTNCGKQKDNNKDTYCEECGSKL